MLSPFERGWLDYVEGLASANQFPPGSEENSEYQRGYAIETIENLWEDPKNSMK